MSKVVNLNQARKSRAREADRRQSDENAVAFGQSKEDRKRLEAAALKIRAALDGHKRER